MEEEGILISGVKTFLPARLAQLSIAVLHIIYLHKPMLKKFAIATFKIVHISRNKETPGY